MFSYDNDLTLSSMMAGNRTFEVRETNKDQEIERSLGLHKYFTSESNDLLYRKSELSEESDECILGLLGPITRDLEIRHYYEHSHTINPLICDKCGIGLNILNKTEYSLCDECNEYEESHHGRNKSSFLL